MKVACNKCGWVHFTVDTWLPSSEARLSRCFRCGNHYSDFRLAEENDCPKGSTIQPILVPPSLKESE